MPATQDREIMKIDNSGHMLRTLMVLIALFTIPGLVLGSGCRCMAADTIPDTERKLSPPIPNAEGATPHPKVSDVTVRGAESELAPGAQETYAYLLYIQAILDEDEAALLDAAQLMQKNPPPQNVWLEGGVWLASRKSPNAVTYLEQALKVFPEDLSLNLLYADALGEHGMPSRGVDAMRSFLQRHPDSLDARIEMALLLVKNRQFEEAREILSKIPPKQRNGLVEYYLGRALAGMNLRAEAIPHLRKATREMPDLVEAMLELAFLYEQEGNWREARAVYEKLQKLRFSPEQVALRLVDLSLKLKQPEKALQYIRQGPDSIAFKLNAANLFLEARHYLQAESILKQIAEKESPPPDVYLLLADLIYEQRRNLNMALSWLDKIPDNSPGAEKAALLRIQLLAEAGKMGQALETVNQYIRKHPNSPEFADMKIRILARDKKLEQALFAAREAAEKWPDNTALTFLLGSILDETGKKAEAFNIMEDIIKKQPDNFQALNYVGFTLADENRDLQRALELLTKADELSPNQAYIVDSLAWALYRAGRGKEALAQIRRAINLGGSPDPAIWEHYGDIANGQGRKDEARKAYRKAIELKPSNVEDIRGRLSRL